MLSFYDTSKYLKKYFIVMQKLEDLRCLEPFQFMPPGVGHLITVVYPKGISEDVTSRYNPIKFKARYLKL